MLPPSPLALSVTSNSTDVERDGVRGGKRIFCGRGSEVAVAVVDAPSAWALSLDEEVQARVETPLRGRRWHVIGGMKFHDNFQ